MKSRNYMFAAAALSGLLAGATMNVSASTANRSQRATIQSQVGAGWPQMPSTSTIARA